MSDKPAETLDMDINHEYVLLLYRANLYSLPMACGWRVDIYKNKKINKSLLFTKPLTIERVKPITLFLRDRYPKHYMILIAKEPICKRAKLFMELLKEEKFVDEVVIDNKHKEASHFNYEIDTYVEDMNIFREKFVSLYKLMGKELENTFEANNWEKRGINDVLTSHGTNLHN
jgi:hypothetical protein